MGKLTSTIGIPIKLLNEAQVRFTLLFALRKLTQANLQIAGPRGNAGDHLGGGVSGKALGGFVAVTYGYNLAL